MYMYKKLVLLVETLAIARGATNNFVSRPYINVLGLGLSVETLTGYFFITKAMTCAKSSQSKIKPQNYLIITVLTCNSLNGL